MILGRMARLGEQLIAAGLVSADKVEQALRAQVVWGARLGTNLIELGCIDLDGLSRALGQQHAMPAALARHFDRADPTLQAQLPVELARQYSVVPLVRLSPERIAVVAMDPLSPDALAALAEIYGVSPRDGIVMSVAAEMRVLYHLERVYKLARPSRYLRSRGASITPFPQFTSVPVEIDSETDIAVPVVVDEAAHPTARVERAPQLGKPEEIAALLDRAIENITVPEAPPGEPTGRDRRTYVRTLADQVERAETLGRIAIRRVAVSASAATVPVRSAPPASLPEATRAIKRGPNRDYVAGLVIDTLERFVPACEAAMLLVIRGDVAIGWKYFARNKEPAPEVAVPLAPPGIVPAVVEKNDVVRSPAEDLGAIDSLLLRALGRSEGDLAVAPIAIGNQVVCLVAAAMEAGAELAPVEAIAAAAGTAFARLIRDASR